MNPIKLQRLYSRYQPDMRRVETLMQDTVKSEQNVLQLASSQLMNAGGKRIRPLIALICSRLGESRPSDDVITLAAAIEMIHMASLVHDDVIDDAGLRRGQATVRARYGNRSAMYTGDFLFARAIALLCKVDNHRVHLRMSDAMVRMCVGEIDQLGDFFNWDQSVRRYLRRIERKTALLIAVSCELGALVAGVDERTAQRLGRFGYYTGMAFQVTDDVLDYVSNQETVGKPVAGDLRQGNLTLPALRARTTSDQGHALSTLVHDGMGEAQLEDALEIIRSSDAIRFTRSMSERFMEKALHCLKGIESTPVYDELCQVSVLLNQRNA